MKWAMYYTSDSALHLGEIIHDVVHQVGNGDLTLQAIMTGALPSERSAVNPAKLAAPVRPGKILAVGRNYAEHAAELGNALPEKPLIFAKYPTSVIASGEAVQWQRSITQKVDWEGELAVIIGKTARRISEADAYDYVFGYTIANDISARDLQDSESQWVRAKAQDTFCPLGPYVVTRDDIPDPHTLNIRTQVNGETMQDSNTRHMIFKIPYLVAYLSQTFTLEPGDMILTGTPSGVGKAQKPPRFLQHGDTVSVSIEGIGTLENPCEVLEG